MNIHDDFGRLRDAGNWRPLVPPSDLAPPSGRVPRSGFVGLAAASIMGIVAIGVWSNVQHDSHSANEAAPAVNERVVVIPWRPIPAHQGAIQLQSASMTPPQCLTSDMRIRTAGGGAAMGTFYVPVTISNAGSQNCTLSDEDLDFVWQSGKSVVEGKGRRILLPKGSQTYRLAFAGGCYESSKGGTMPVSVVPSLHGAKLDATATTLPSLVNGCTTASLTAVEPASSMDSGTSPYSHLRASLNIPSNVTGATLDYTVTITNEGSSETTFSSCPTYTQMVGTNTSVDSSSYSLACSKNDAIGPNESRTYAMHADVPDGTGEMKLVWIMDDGPSDGGATNSG